MNHSMTHFNYGKLEQDNPVVKEHVDNMFSLLVEYAEDNNITTALDDRAENLVEAIATYIVKSEKSV